MIGRTGIEDKLGEVRDLLEQMRGRLEALSSAIWQDIDHEDTARLEAGVRFKQSYNEHRESLEGTMDRMLALLRDGEIVGAEQEERFSGKKHDTRFPVNVIELCLDMADIGVENPFGG